MTDRYAGITFSQAAVEAVLADIRNGVTYPDFWNDRDEEEDEQEEEVQEEKE